MTSVAARDKNNPPHYQVEYSMENNRTTGDIFLHSTLDRETFPSDFDLGLNSRLTYSLLTTPSLTTPGPGIFSTRCR